MTPSGTSAIKGRRKGGLFVFEAARGGRQSFTEQTQSMATPAIRGRLIRGVVIKGSRADRSGVRLGLAPPEGLLGFAGRCALAIAAKGLAKPAATC
jgi:hypothetical protein